jgi:hypothetical protein
MQRLGLLRATALLAGLFSLAHCAVSDNNGQGTGQGGSGVGQGGSGVGQGGSGVGQGGSGVGQGGSTGAGGSGSGQGGSTGVGGSGSGQGGSTGVGGSGSGQGGSTGTGGSGSIKDAGGVGLARPGDMNSTSRQYLNLGDMRLINNRWGSDARNCTGTMQSVFVNTDKTFGWMFNRPTCGGARGNPDFPEVEFGVAPFGMTSSNLTTPAFSSTTLLPIQLSKLTSASVTFDNFATTFQKPGYYDNNFEFWISRMDPRTNANAGVYAEIIVFTAWEAGRENTAQGGWTCDQTGTVTSSGQTYKLCHQSDTWSNGQWRFFNFDISNGPFGTVNGKIDVKAFLDYIRGRYTGFTDDMWLTRIEVGTEVDDQTQGSANIHNLTFEINNQSRSAQFAP